MTHCCTTASPPCACQLYLTVLGLCLFCDYCNCDSTPQFHRLFPTNVKLPDLWLDTHCWPTSFSTLITGHTQKPLANMLQARSRYCHPTSQQMIWNLLQHWRQYWLSLLTKQSSQDEFTIFTYQLYCQINNINYTVLPWPQPCLKNCGCPFLPVSTNVQLQRSKASRGEECRGCPPPQPTRESGGRRMLSQRGLGQSPSRKRFWGASCATHLLAHLTAAWKREIPTSLYWLVDLIFDNFFGVSDTPTWIFGVSLGYPWHPQ